MAYFHLPVHIDQGNSIGKAVEGLLCRLLHPDQFCFIVSPEFTQTCRHLIECIRELAYLVMGVAGDHQVEIPMPDLINGMI
ncbi:MAG: hypothetical protein MZV70_57395 [Desulfobacterales bacterium]|nr:hypothetical protein [Desulfobacterales bacterium]